MLGGRRRALLTIEPDDAQGVDFGECLLLPRLERGGLEVAQPDAFRGGPCHIGGGGGGPAGPAPEEGETPEPPPPLPAAGRLPPRAAPARHHTPRHARPRQ